MVPINNWVVFAAAIVQMILGGLWYGPFFGKSWSALMGFTPETMAAAKKGMARSYVLMFIGALLMAWILAHAIFFATAYLAFYGAAAGIAVGFLNWLGFVAPVTLGSVLWEGKPWRLWLLNAGYYLVGLCLMGALIGAWH